MIRFGDIKKFEVSSIKSNLFPTPNTANTFLMAINNNRRSSLATPSSVPRLGRRRKKTIMIVQIWGKSSTKEALFRGPTVFPDIPNVYFFCSSLRTPHRSTGDHLWQRRRQRDEGGERRRKWRAEAEEEQKFPTISISKRKKIDYGGKISLFPNPNTIYTFMKTVHKHMRSSLAPLL